MVLIMAGRDDDTEVLNLGWRRFQSQISVD